MDKKAVGLSIISLTAAATLFGATQAHADDLPPIIDGCGEVKCDSGPGNPDPFIKLRLQSDVFDKVRTDVFIKLDAENLFHKFDQAFHKFQIVGPD